MKREITFCDYPDCKEPAETFYTFSFHPISGMTFYVSINIAKGFGGGGMADLCPKHEIEVTRAIANHLLELCNKAKY